MARRLLDVILSVVCLILAAAPMAAIALAIRLFDGSPVLFRQRRVGRGMRVFSLYKFRTMKSLPNMDCPLTPAGDPRVTGIGGFLRRFRLDELPQLFNIVAGQMTFVGPRPEVPEFVDPQDPIQQQVYSVRPGLFDQATLRWFDEPYVLSRAADPKEYYRDVILPDKLACSLSHLETRTLVKDIRLVCAIFSRLLLSPKHETRLRDTP